jgi:poly-beta-1,6-N-acetyl-D-glucosamine synthase
VPLPALPSTRTWLRLLVLAPFVLAALVLGLGPTPAWGSPPPSPSLAGDTTIIESEEPVDPDAETDPASTTPGTGRQIAVGAVLIVLTIGGNFLIWGGIGLIRFVDERTGRRRGGPPPDGPSDTRVERRHLAIVMAAHNEEAVITPSLRAVRELVPRHNIYVANDGSTDATSSLARAAGVNVLDVVPNRGKAGALRAVLEHFELFDRYRAVLFVDADTHLDPGYLDAALPWLNDPEVVAVAGYAKPLWCPERRSWLGKVLAAHRHRLYALTQILQKYGQTWRLSNVAYIVPGFASIYRTSVLRHIDIDPPGLVIEDFNMTFEIHHRGLGRIAFTPDALALCHEPSNYRDYVSQVRRWVLGFWQTVRRHGVWPGAFWAALALWIAEVLIASIVFTLLPVVVALLVLPELWGGAMEWTWFASVHGLLSQWVTLPVVLAVVFVPDLIIMTVLGIRDRRWLYPLLALGFPLFRVTDAFLGLVTIPRAWTQTSTGMWRSPTRN